jgi:hypothetical protein
MKCFKLKFGVVVDWLDSLVFFWKLSGWSCWESCGIYEYIFNQSGRFWYYSRIIKIQGSLTILNSCT